LRVGGKKLRWRFRWESNWLIFWTFGWSNGWFINGVVGGICCLGNCDWGWDFWGSFSILDLSCSEEFWFWWLWFWFWSILDFKFKFELPFCFWESNFDFGLWLRGKWEIECVIEWGVWLEIETLFEGIFKGDLLDGFRWIGELNNGDGVWDKGFESKLLFKLAFCKLFVLSILDFVLRYKFVEEFKLLLDLRDKLRLDVEFDFGRLLEFKVEFEFEFEIGFWFDLIELLLVSFWDAIGSLVWEFGDIGDIGYCLKDCDEDWVFGVSVWDCSCGWDWEFGGVNIWNWNCDCDGVWTLDEGVSCKNFLFNLKLDFFLTKNQTKRKKERKKETLNLESKFFLNLEDVEEK